LPEPLAVVAVAAAAAAWRLGAFARRTDTRKSKRQQQQKNHDKQQHMPAAEGAAATEVRIAAAFLRGRPRFRVVGAGGVAGGSSAAAGASAADVAGTSSSIATATPCQKRTVSELCTVRHKTVNRMVCGHATSSVLAATRPGKPEPLLLPLLLCFAGRGTLLV
jgi:hypothetical protein